jgi:hypothetical protein
MSLSTSLALGYVQNFKENVYITLTEKHEPQAAIAPCAIYLLQDNVCITFFKPANRLFL